MAKQVINVGQEANDGTGDALRTAMQKIVSNFDELYDDAFSGDYDDLTNKPDSILDFGITDGTANQVLVTDGDGGFSFADAAATYSNDDVDTHLNVSSASNNQILSWNGTDYAWVNDAQGSGGGGLSNTEVIEVVTGSNLDMQTNKIINVGTPTANTDVATKAYVDSEVANAGGGSSLQSRANVTGTTSSIANNASANLDITGYKGYALLKIQTDRAAWVRVYTDASSRTADASRAETSDPAPDAGVIAEVITTGAQTILVSPGVYGFNNESTPTTTIPCAVTNKSGSASTVQVTLTVIQLEA